MSSEPLTLSKGAIKAIMEETVIASHVANAKIHPPLVQIIDSKTMDKGRVRLVIDDGNDKTEHCIIDHHEAERLYNEGLFDQYTVLRIWDFRVKAMPGDKNINVILVDNLEFVKEGRVVGQKLEGTECDYLASQRVDDDVSPVAVPAPDFRLPMMAIQKVEEVDVITSSGKRKNTELPVSSKKTTTMNTTAAATKAQKYTMVADLLPSTGNWVIRVCVTEKSLMKGWSNHRGSGVYFDFIGADEKSKIRFVAFKELATHWYDKIVVGGHYIITDGTVKDADKRFNALKNKYEVHINGFTVIESENNLPDSAPANQPKRYFFRALKALTSLNERGLVKCKVSFSDCFILL